MYSKLNFLGNIMKNKFMAHIFKSFSFTAIFLFLSCFPVSINPIYTNNSLISKDQLIGIWKRQEKEINSQEDSLTLIISKLDSSSYHVEIKSKDTLLKNGSYIGHLTELSGKLIVDLAPCDTYCKKDSNLERLLFLPTHTFILVEIRRNLLSIRLLNGDWLSYYLKKHPNSLEHFMYKNLPIIYSETKKVRNFFTSKIEDGIKIFEDACISFNKIEKIEDRPTKVKNIKRKK